MLVCGAKGGVSRQKQVVILMPGSGWDGQERPVGVDSLGTPEMKFSVPIIKLKVISRCMAFDTVWQLQTNNFLFQFLSKDDMG